MILFSHIENKIFAAKTIAINQKMRNIHGVRSFERFV